MKSELYTAMVIEKVSRLVVGYIESTVGVIAVTLRAACWTLMPTEAVAAETVATTVLPPVVIKYIERLAVPVEVLTEEVPNTELPPLSLRDTVQALV